MSSSLKGKTTKYESVYVSPDFYASIENKCELDAIIKGIVNHLIPINGKLFCLSGAVGKGTGIGWALMNAYEAVPLSDYKNQKTPLAYHEHFSEVDKGIRDRSYDGLLVKCKSKNFVLVGPRINILPSAENQAEEIKTVQECDATAAK